MNTAQMKALIAATFDRMSELSRTKGEEYVGGAEANRLQNFLSAGERLGLNPLTALHFALDKHYNSFTTYVKEQQAGVSRELSEPIEGRLDDMILYAILAKGLIAELRGDHAKTGAIDLSGCRRVEDGRPSAGADRELEDQYYAHVATASARRAVAEDDGPICVVSTFEHPAPPRSVGDLFARLESMHPGRRLAVSGDDGHGRRTVYTADDVMEVGWWERVGSWAAWATPGPPYREVDPDRDRWWETVLGFHPGATRHSGMNGYEARLPTGQVVGYYHGPRSWDFDIPGRGSVGPDDPHWLLEEKSTIGRGVAGEGKSIRVSPGTRLGSVSAALLEPGDALTLESLQEEVDAWASEVFPERSVDTIRKKLIQEAMELVLALAIEHWDDIEDEVADVQILVLDLCKKRGIDLLAVTRRKHLINVGRDWTIDKDGLSRHV
jgi:NTP pyrophosphatase (non-canonical NTP hydrolase)